ncbi:MAG: hypothetical protein Q7S22_01805 [Candidatus Micrarchaeota archaeon]|nr:hypothetical protein [Candidatus Micrarchaeota archaeon]
MQITATMVSGKQVVPARKGMVLELVEPINKKLGMKEALEAIPLQMDRKRKTIVELFRCPITKRTSIRAFKNDQSASDAILKLNQMFREKYGQDAVIKEYIFGKRCGFWILTLNPKLFDITPELSSEYKLKPGIDIALDDILPPSHLKLVKTIARNHLCSKNEIRQNGISSSILSNALVRKGVNERFCLVKNRLSIELNEIIRRTKREPNLYYLDEKFVRAFDIKLGRSEPLIAQCFSEIERKIIVLLCSHDQLRVYQINEELGILPQNFSIIVNRINSKCHEFGWPDAMINDGGTGNRTCKINQEFLDRHHIPHITVRDFSNYFSNRQIDVIEFVMANPLSNIAEVATHFGYNRKYVWDLFDELDKRCKKIEEVTEEVERKFPLLIRVGRYETRFAFSKEFYRIFGRLDDYVHPNPLKAFLGDKNGVIYKYLIAHPKQKNVDAAKALGMTAKVLGNHTARINIDLEAAGLEPLPRKCRKKGSVARDIVRKELIRIRKETGEWSGTELLNRAEQKKGLQRALTKYGTITLAITTSLHALTSEEEQKIIENDGEKIKMMNFGRFKNLAGDIRLACLGALNRGAEFANIERIMRINKSGETVLAQINELEDKWGIPDFSPQRFRTASNSYVELG